MRRHSVWAWHGVEHLEQRVLLSADPLPAGEPIISGDLDLDGDVDIVDFSRLAGFFGQDGNLTYYHGDLNGDSGVDQLDFAIQAGNFGQVGTGPDTSTHPIRTGSIHGLKWEDRNGNGRRDSSEPGVPGVTVFLDLDRDGKLDDHEPHTVTMEDDPDTAQNEAGRYWLRSVPPGTYTVAEVVPDGWSQTSPGARAALSDSFSEQIEHGGANDFQVIGAAAVSGDASGAITVELTYEISWATVCSDLLPDLTSHSVRGEKIHIDIYGRTSSEACILIMPTPTQHEVRIDALRPRTYSLSVTLHESRGDATAAFNPTWLSKANLVVSGRNVHVITVDSGEVVDGVDFDNRLPATGSIHGLKWRDDNGNAERDPGEPGLAGVTIYIDSNRNGMLDSGERRTVTMGNDPDTSADKTGHYWLKELEPGTYVIGEVVPDGFEQTFPRTYFDPTLASGTPDVIRPDILPLGFHVVLLKNGGMVKGIDFGNRPIHPGSIHGLKWRDDNGNGKRDTGEPGLAGVTIYLDVNRNGEFDSDEPHAVTMADISGTPQNQMGVYWIENVEPGFYLVREVVPDGFEQTFPEVLRCKAIFCTGRAHMINLEPGDELKGIDFGNQPIEPELGSIHGVKWLDRNGNAKRDPDEPGLPGVTVYLDVNLNGAFDRDEPHAMTMEGVLGTPVNDTGRYWIEDVEPGFYLVQEVVPDGFERTFPGPEVRVIESQSHQIEPDIALDFVLTGSTAAATPGNEIDVALELTVVWTDTCGVLIRDMTTHRVEGSEIFIRMFGEQVGTNCAEVITRQSQVVEVGALSAGRYTVMATLHEEADNGVVGSANLFVPTWGVKGGVIGVEVGGSHTVKLEPGQIVNRVDFGNRPVRKGSIHGLKWQDDNGNGQRDPDELGPGGVTIYVDLNNNGVFDEDEPHAVTMEENPFTDFYEGGLYRIDGLAAGRYIVREVVPDGFVQTFPHLGRLDAAEFSVGDVPFVGGVHPTRIDVTLARGQMLTTEVSLTIEPFCVRPFLVDVVASDPNAMLENLTGVCSSTAAAVIRARLR